MSVPSSTAKRIVRTAEAYYRAPTVHGDPLKEQKARTESLHNGSRTLIDVCAEDGLDWETQLQKQHKVDVKRLELAAELKAKADELGLSADETSAALAAYLSNRLGKRHHRN